MPGAVPLVSGIPSFIQSKFGKQGNFEVITPLLNTPGYLYISRDNDNPALPWSQVAVLGSTISPGNFPYPSGSLIQSNFGPPPGNLEYTTRSPIPMTPAIFNQGPLIGLFGSGVAAGWSLYESAAVIPPMVSVIQSRNGIKGNFELVGPPDTFLYHFWRNNDAATLPWSGPTATFGNPGNSKYQLACLIESNFGSPGNLEVIAETQSGELHHCYRDSTGWHGPDVIPTGMPLGCASFIQSTYGTVGNFELVACGNGTWHFWRNNDVAGLPWNGPTKLPDLPNGAVAAACCLIESNYGNLEVVVRDITGNLYYYSRPGGVWSNPTLITLA